MVRSREQEINSAARTLGQHRRFYHPINADKVFGTHSLKFLLKIATSSGRLPGIRSAIISKVLVTVHSEPLGGIFVNKLHRVFFCLPFSSKFSGASHFSNAALRAGHSEANIENQAVSLLRPF